MTCDRRMFLLATSTTLAGAYLAACGKEPSVEISATAVPVGGGVIVDGVIFAQPTAGEYKAYSTTCPHQGSAITKIDGLHAICTSHFSTFDLATGKVISGPARAGMLPYGVETDGVALKNTPSKK